jgi:hypothetical protein
MKTHQATYPVRVMGRLLGSLQDIALTARIRAIHRRSEEAYGAPSIHAELADDHDIRVSRKRMARLMRAAGLLNQRPCDRFQLVKCKCSFHCIISCPLVYVVALFDKIYDDGARIEVRVAES